MISGGIIKFMSCMSDYGPPPKPWLKGVGIMSVFVCPAIPLCVLPDSPCLWDVIVRQSQPMAKGSSSTKPR